MYCPSCGTKNNYYHRYCFQCGSALSKLPEDSEVAPARSEISSGKKGPSQTEPILSIPDADNEDMPDLHLGYNDFLMLDGEDGRFDITGEIPLRRYRKETGEGRGLKYFLTVLIGLLLLSVLLVIAYLGWEQLPRNAAKPVATLKPLPAAIDLQTHVERLLHQERPARRITLYSQAGEQVRLLGRLLPVIGGKAELIVTELELYALAPTQGEETVLISVNVLVLADGYPNLEEILEIEISVPYAPLQLIHPPLPAAETESSRFALVLMVEPGSRVWIDDDNYSHLVDGSGRLSVQLNAEAESNHYTIRVITSGHADTIQDLFIKRTVQDVPLSVNQTIPIKASGQRVEVTGITLPDAELSSSLAFISDPIIDSETGAFRAWVTVPHAGYNLFELTARVEGKPETTLSLVIDQAITEVDYTARAWAIEYQRKKNNPSLYEGRIFAFNGVVQEILALGHKNILIVNAGSDNEDMPFHVEIWGSVHYAKGDSIRVFGNRWGSVDGLPRLLARHVYR